jgi:O-6-methylguanine DNA methyltransferase
MTVFESKIYKVVQHIPKGKVSTYRAVACAAGRPAAARAVGNALNKNPFPDVPCHRVVRSDRSVGGYAHGSTKKHQRLSHEGVVFQGGIVLPQHVLDNISFG